MAKAGIRRYRDTLLFALAYGAVIGAVLFAHPFRNERVAAPVTIAAGSAG